MKRRILFVVLASMVATAQQATTSDPACLLATERADWVALGIDHAQLEQEMDLHTACVTDHTMPKGAEHELVPVPSVMKEYEDRVRKVLGEEKYAQWLQWCATRPTKG